MGKTSIEWTDCTWNPITGCSEISPGCANCYAARLQRYRDGAMPPLLRQIQRVGGVL